MLISMPTGTSTIFGAFQAIFGAPFGLPDETPPLGHKVPRQKKFASKIFRQLLMLHCERSHGFVRVAWSKRRGVNRFVVAGHAANVDLSG
jgi:hypothetical protein